MMDPQKEAEAELCAALELVGTAMRRGEVGMDRLSASIAKAERERSQMASRERDHGATLERLRAVLDENRSLHAMVKKLAAAKMSDLQAVKDKDDALGLVEQLQVRITALHRDIEALRGDVADARDGIGAAVIEEGERKDADWKVVVGEAARRATLEKAELEDRIMSLSVCRNSTTVTVSEGMLKQQLGESRGEVTALKSIVASLKAELDAQRVSQKIQQFRMGGAAPGPQAGSRTGACDANNTNNSTGGGPVPLDGDKNPAPKGNSRPPTRIDVETSDEEVSSDDEFAKSGNKRGRGQKQKTKPAAGKATVKKTKGAPGASATKVAQLNFSWPDPGGGGGGATPEGGGGAKDNDADHAKAPETKPAAGRHKAKAKVDVFDYI